MREDPRPVIELLKTPESDKRITDAIKILLARLSVCGRLSEFAKITPSLNAFLALPHFFTKTDLDLRNEEFCKAYLFLTDGYSRGMLVVFENFDMLTKEEQKWAEETTKRYVQLMQDEISKLSSVSTIPTAVARSAPANQVMHARVGSVLSVENITVGELKKILDGFESTVSCLSRLFSTSSPEIVAIRKLTDRKGDDVLISKDNIQCAIGSCGDRMHILDSPERAGKTGVDQVINAIGQFFRDQKQAGPTQKR